LQEQEGASYRDLLNAHQFKRTGVVTVLFEAQGDHLAYALHQGVEAFGLRMASAKRGNGTNEIALLVFLNHDGEFSTGPHALPRVLTLSRYAFANIPWAAANLVAERSVEAVDPVYFFSGFLAK
jgi:hypothetical protein